MGIKNYFRNVGIRRWIDSKLRARRLSRMYVIADGGDNSVTLSHALCRHICLESLEAAKVFVFRIPESGEYGFAINPDVGDGAPLADIQYNSRYHCVGFESLVPTVNRIFYDYGIPAVARARLSVVPRSSAGTEYYIICRPCGT